MYRISGRIRYPAGYCLSGHNPVSGSYYPVNLNYFFYLTAHVWRRGNLYVHTFCHAEGIRFTRQRSRDCCLARVLLVHYYCSLLFSFWLAALALGEGERHDSRSSHRRCWLCRHCHPEILCCHLVVLAENDWWAVNSVAYKISYIG